MNRAPVAFGSVLFLSCLVVQADLVGANQQPWQIAEYPITARLSGVAGRWLESNWMRLKSDGEFLILAYEIPPDRRSEFWEAFYNVWAEQFQFEIEWLKKTERMTGDEIHEKVPWFLTNQPISQENLIRLAESIAGTSDCRICRFRFVELAARRDVIGVAGIDDKIDATKAWNSVVANRGIVSLTYQGRPVSDNRNRMLAHRVETEPHGTNIRSEADERGGPVRYYDRELWSRPIVSVPTLNSGWENSPGTFDYCLEHRAHVWTVVLRRAACLRTGATDPRTGERPQVSVAIGRADMIIGSLRDQYLSLDTINDTASYRRELARIEQPLEALHAELLQRIEFAMKEQSEKTEVPQE